MGVHRFLALRCFPEPVLYDLLGEALGSDYGPSSE